MLKRRGSNYSSKSKVRNFFLWPFSVGFGPKICYQKMSKQFNLCIKMRLYDSACRLQWCVDVIQNHIICYQSNIDVVMWPTYSHKLEFRASLENWLWKASFTFKSRFNLTLATPEIASTFVTNFTIVIVISLEYVDCGIIQGTSKLQCLKLVITNWLHYCFKNTSSGTILNIGFSSSSLFL